MDHPDSRSAPDTSGHQTLGTESLKNVDPIAVLQGCLQEAQKTEVWATAVCLATASHDGKPSNRMMTLREVSHHGLYFATSMDSRKARDLAESPYAAMATFWPSTHKQWRAEGRVMLEETTTADRYFAESPRQEQILVWASRDGHAQTPHELATDVDSYNREFGGINIPRPSKWRVFRVVPEAFEFWQADSVDWKDGAAVFLRVVRQHTLCREDSQQVM